MIYRFRGKGFCIYKSGLDLRTGLSYSQKLDEEDIFKRPCLSSKITYGYEYGKNKFGIIDIADTAKSYGKDGTLLGEARALRLFIDMPVNKLENIENRGVGRYLVVEEIYHDRDGSMEIIYRGQLIFDTHISGFGGGGLRGVHVREIKILGKKQYDLFWGWPLGGP